MGQEAEGDAVSLLKEEKHFLKVAVRIGLPPRIAGALLFIEEAKAIQFLKLLEELEKIGGSK